MHIGKYGSLALALMLLVGGRLQARADEMDDIFTQWRMGVAAEGSAAHFGDRLNRDIWVQALSLTGHFTVLPFGLVHYDHLDGILDGAAELGAGPVFERFDTQHQDFGGLDFQIRYYLTHFAWGPVVPWVEASIAPGGTDLHLEDLRGRHRLTGPFAALIQGGVGLSYFFSERGSVYAGLHSQHVSNGGFNGPDRNLSLNTAYGAVLGVEWLFGP